MRNLLGRLALALTVLVAIWGLLLAGGVLQRPGTPPAGGVGVEPEAPAVAAVDPAVVELQRRRVDAAIARGEAVGVVLEADGTPAAGAEVVAFEDRNPSHPAESATTDDDGRFALTPFVGLDIVAWRRGAACSEWQEVGEDTDELTLTLSHGATVSGRVALEKGGFAEQAIVDLQFAAGVNPPSWRTRSGADGGYVFAGVPSGWWVRPCVAYSGRHGPASGEYGPFTLPSATALVKAGQAHVAGDDGDAFERDLVARYFAAAPVTFRLQFPEGVVPPAELRVETWNADRSGHSSGPEIVDPYAPEFLRALDVGDELVVCVRGGIYVGETGVLSFDSEEPRTIWIDMERAPLLHARLVDADGSEAARAGVDVLVGVWRGDSASVEGAATTGPDGIADLTWHVPFASILDDPRIGVVFVLEGGGTYSAMLLGDAPNLRLGGPELAAMLRSGDDPVMLDIPLIEPKPLVITCVDAAGEPVADVVLATAAGKPLWPARVTTGDDGRASFDIVSELPHRTVSIRAEDPWRGALQLGRGIGAGGPLADGGEVRMTVRPVATHRVRVVDAGGVPVAHAGVRCRGHVHLTDASGACDVRGASGDAVQLSLPNHVVVTARLPADGSLTTLVAEPLRTVTVRVASDDPEWRGRLTCEARIGNATFDAATLTVVSEEPPVTTISVPFESGTVHVESRHGLWVGHGDLGAGDTEITIALRPAPRHTVRFRVVDAGGAPLPATRVTLRSRRVPRLVNGQVNAELVTDVDGEIRATLPAGKARAVEYRVGDDPWASATLDVPADHAIELRAAQPQER